MLFQTKLSLIASRKLVSLRKKWKKYLMTKMTCLLARKIQFKPWKPILQYYRKSFQIDDDITSDDYIDFDIEVFTSHGKLTNQEILAEIYNDVHEESDGEEEDPNDFDRINKPGIEDAREALQVLEDFGLLKIWGINVKVIKRIKS